MTDQKMVHLSRSFPSYQTCYFLTWNSSSTVVFKNRSCRSCFEYRRILSEGPSYLVSQFHCSRAACHDGSLPFGMGERETYHLYTKYMGSMGFCVATHGSASMETRDNKQTNPKSLSFTHTLFTIM